MSYVSEYFANPSTIIVTGSTDIDQINLVNSMLGQMDYSDIWVYSPRSNLYVGSFRLIGCLSAFIHNLTNQKYVSDCLLVIIDSPPVQDLPSVYKLLSMAQTHDIYIILVDSGEIAKSEKMMGYIDYKCSVDISCGESKPLCFLYSDLKSCEKPTQIEVSFNKNIKN